MPLLQNNLSEASKYVGFDYQSECHCSKTIDGVMGKKTCLTTSQNATAPKRSGVAGTRRAGLTTSQNATAPKRHVLDGLAHGRLTTSQNATAPKPSGGKYGTDDCLTTSQNATAPKLTYRDIWDGPV